VTAKHDANGLEGFELSVDRDAEVPIGVQLAWALRARIHDGRFKPGQRLPGLRELADATGVNVNTIRAVYQRLDQQGLIDLRQGRGTFVGPTLRKPSDVATIVANAVREARETGVDPREVAAALYVEPEAAHPSDTPAERRRLLRTQIAALERALGDIEAEHPGVAPAPSETRRGPGPALLGSEQLEQIRMQLVRRLAVVQAAVDERHSEAAGENELESRSAHARDVEAMEIVKGPKPTARSSKKSARAPKRAAAGTERAQPRGTSRPAAAEA
jgi:GntR family transcriptional regulator